MRKYKNILMGILLILYTSVSIGQQLEQKSTIKISEKELTSLVEILKKYKIQQSINNDSIKKSTILNLQNTAIDSEDKNMQLKSINNTSADLKNNEVIVNRNELLNIQNEIKELKAVLNTLVLNQAESQLIDTNSSENLKNSENVIEQNNSVPKTIISESFIYKTDTILIIDKNSTTKKTDSILLLKLNSLELRAKESDSILKDLVKNKIKKSDSIIDNSKQKDSLNDNFNDLYFENNESELSINHQSLLKALTNLALSKKSIHVYLKGYASNTGNKNYNKTLSLKRTESVKKYLIINGVEVERISSNFFGIDYNENDEAKARRVEINILNN